MSSPFAADPPFRACAAAFALASAAPGQSSHEPPLLAGFETAPDLTRREVSVRWLCASILTGLAGAALLGSAIYVSLEGEVSFAEVAERVVAPAPHGEGITNAARKGDKLVRSEMVASAKQTFRSPVTIRVGDREAIKVRTFVRIATNLSLTSGVYATDIPPFNPLRFFADEGGADRSAEPAPEVSDAEASVVKSDLGSAPMDAGAPALSDQEVAAQIQEERRIALEAGRRPVVPLAPQLMLSRTLADPARVAPDAFGTPGSAVEPRFKSIDVRVVPENVTNYAKGDSRSSPPLFEERDVAIRRGDTLDSLLRANGASADQARAVIAALGREKTAGVLDGKQLRILTAPPLRPGEPRQVSRVVLFGENGVEAIAAANDRGAFLSVKPLAEDGPRRNASRPPNGGEEEGEEEEDSGGVRLYDSLYETALKQELPRQTVDELVRIFGYDVDFQRRVSAGDSFEIFYAPDEEGGSDRPEVLYAALTVGGEARRVYRYQGEDGAIDYFDEMGRSLRKFLLRKPITEAVLRSGFGLRRHPILGYSKMHTGVDWANRIGTPILAAGNGTVIRSGWEGGYGRRTEIQHANGYVTAYNHQSGYARGVAPGARVRQGQVIGYVGSTGLSTGPHLHYEVIVNGHFVDPLKIKVPRGRELDGRALADFSRQREQTDLLIQKAGGSTRLAETRG
jgi:murein DD-endopeptidase MepM/ murein hydrolase activator NlpD